MKIVKKSIAIFLVLTVLLGFAGCSLNELIGKDAEYLKYSVKNGEATVTECTAKSTLTKVVIPDEYEGVPVTKVKNFGVVNTENVAEIVIGKNVKEIEDWAFTNNGSLEKFTVSKENEWFCDVDGVLFTKDIKTLLFYPASRGKEKVKATDENGKETETEIIEYIIPKGVETIRTKAFYKCWSLLSVSIPSSVTRIEEKAFFRCDILKEINLPDNLDYIGKDAFAYCTAVSEVEIPASVKEIDEYAFYNCTELKNVKVDNAESNLVLGKKWYPTNNGRSMDDLKILWEK